jgi:UDP-N-acetylmuramyl tripeptide synthase
MMGRIAARLARLVFVTDEDPRDEEREAILESLGGSSESKRETVS